MSQPKGQRRVKASDLWPDSIPMLPIVKDSISIENTLMNQIIYNREMMNHPIKIFTLKGKKAK